MTDRFTQAERSTIMRSVRSSDTTPEMVVRRWLHRHGYRFRLHRKDLPGTPDIVLPKYRIAIFINGCFWHRHEGCKRASMPQTNTEYWEKKLTRNAERDRTSHEELAKLGWSVVIIWECEIGAGTFKEELLSALSQG
jgi:DNA mismatch endonuclease (patch repair protein)